MAKLTMVDLEQMNPCSEAMEWVRTTKDLQTAWDTCVRADWMIWYLRRKSLFDKQIAVKFAILCAERVLKIFEDKYPEDKRPRLAIEAAKNYLQDPTSARAAADAARDAADAAGAAYAAYAAYAAADAAGAAYAADAAYADAAAYAAACAAAYADAAAYAAERKWQAETLRTLVENPFK